MNRPERRRQVHGSKAQLDALMDAAVDAIVLIDVDGHITLFSHAAERMFGFTAKEVLGQNVNCLMPQPYKNEHDGYLQRYLKTGQARIIGVGREVQGRRKDGTTFAMELSVGEVKHKETLGFVGIIRDITQRKQLEGQLLQQGNELKLIFDYAPTAIAVVALDERILNCNRAWHDLLGYDALPAGGLFCRDFLHADDYLGFSSGIGKLKEAKVETWRTESRIITQANKVLHVRAQVGVIRGEDGAQFFILEFIDQSAQVHAEQEAAQLRENMAHMARLNTMGEMATGIAHELNQPLTAIGTYAQAMLRLIKSGAIEPGEVVDTLGKIYEQSERAGEVIRRLRTMLVRGKEQREHTDSTQLIRDIVRLAELDLRDSNVSLQLQITDHLPVILVDKVQIQQVILNLLRNAMDAMSESSTGNVIVISTRVTSERVLEIGVTDSGPGIGDEVASQIFDAFYTTKPGGLGMGLAICRSILQSHGGNLRVSNNRYGGATFTVCLPIGEDDLS
jgi:two-component system, LuxR family, sensor kinase FixL